MTMVRVDEAGIRSVINALESAAAETRLTSAFLSTHGLGAAALATLSGHGLAAGVLVARMESLAVSTASHAHELDNDVQLTADWGNALIGSQVFRTSGRDWKGIINDGRRLLNTGWSERKWLSNFAKYVEHGDLAKHSKTWTKFGDYGRAFSRTGLGAATLLGTYIGGSAGGVIEAGGTVLSSAWGLRTLELHWANNGFARFLGSKAAGKAFLPIAALSVALSAKSLATTDLQEAIHGDAAGHSDATRSVLYGAKVLDTVGTATFAVGLVTGNPVLIGAGLVFTGVSAIARGTIFATDYVHEHHITLKSAAAGVVKSLTPQWPHIHTPRLPAWSL